MLLLLLSCVSCVRLCATPQTEAHQAPLSLGFSRQEHWSGLPFPSLMHESEKLKVKSLSRVRLLATPWTVAYEAPPSMGFPRQEYGSGVPLPSPICHHTFIQIIGCIIPRVNPKVNYGLWTIMTCHCRFTFGKKCAILVSDIDKGKAVHV